MKIAAFDVRKDEELYMREAARSFGIELNMVSDWPTPANAALAAGCEGVTVLGNSAIDAKLLDIWKEAGVAYLSTRTVGYNHIDITHAQEIGIKVCNAAYAPNGVADFTVMLMLMCLRHYKQSFLRGQSGDYSLPGLQGREMKDLTAGIIGTGRIGRAVIKNLSGFGCRILAYDTYQNDAVRELAEYTDLETLYRECDVISLHIPFFPGTYHMIGSEAISRMKDGVIIVNCARGELIDTKALIHGIESGKIGALGLDTVEGEQGIVHADHRQDIPVNRDMAYLRQFPNVVMTQHFAFYTKAAVKSMVDCGLNGIVMMKKTGTCPTMITA